jgi:pyrophosphate--fructose-6-phosphate 1-phosphotransferase
MTPHEQQRLATLLQHPEVEAVTRDINQERIDRRQYRPPLCRVLTHPLTCLSEDERYGFSIDPEAQRQLPDIINNKVQTIMAADAQDKATAKRFAAKRRIGVVFSGGPAPGGHNVIAGLFDAARKANPDNEIWGFLLGPDGIVENEVVKIDRPLVDQYRNCGGFTMIKTGRTKIDTAQKMAAARRTCRELKLDALVVVGGDDSNTNAAFLAQEMLPDGVQVIGVPKTIDGDIQVRDAKGAVLCAISFGFHTAARAFSHEISNLCTDCSSDVKYWHICKVMGRVASHLALEVGLQTHANMTLIGEELAEFIDYSRIERAQQSNTVDYSAYGMTLRHLSRLICDGIVRRAAAGKNYGVIVIPEGVLEFINEIQTFIIKLNTIIADYNATHDTDFHTDFALLDDKLEYLRRLARRSREDESFTVWNTRDDDLFNDIPEFFQEGLLTERDSHGNFQFSLVPTDKVLLGLVKDYLKILYEQGAYRIGIKGSYFSKLCEQAAIDPAYYGPLLFDDYDPEAYLLIKPQIISLKTLRQTLWEAGALSADAEIPEPIMKIYTKAVPNFKTQSHFYGYDGRGNDPTRFDCIYAYNLGATVFSLVANGATGQMAAIKNLEKNFEDWRPIGIPIAPLMHLEERKGKLALVLEKSVVDTQSNAFQVFKAHREKWLAANPGEDHYRRPGPIRFTGDSEEDRPMTLKLNSLETT